jgi:two-component system, cell cycle sensor histidine kinase and response regulator CckA
MRAEATQLIEEKTPQAHGPVILLVEDESVVREVTREVLVDAGYSVLESGTPAEALELASRHAGAIDLLLTDMVMPGMNGAELANQLCALQPHVVAVFMSGYAEGDVMEKIKRTSAIHIQKPFTVNMLLSRVREALRAGVTLG